MGTKILLLTYQALGDSFKPPCHVYIYIYVLCLHTHPQQIPFEGVRWTFKILFHPPKPFKDSNEILGCCNPIAGRGWEILIRTWWYWCDWWWNRDPLQLVVQVRLVQCFTADSTVSLMLFSTIPGQHIQSLCSKTFPYNKIHPWNLTSLGPQHREKWRF